jgi:type IV pilus assembly protein PilE
VNASAFRRVSYWQSAGGQVEQEFENGEIMLVAHSESKVTECSGSPRNSRNGFTLIELMIVVAIVAILSAVALPAYNDYVIRSRLADAFSALSSAASSAEQFWANNRTYVGLAGSNAWPVNSATFSYTLANADASAFTITATGAGPVAGFVYTINQDGTRATTAVKSGWGSAQTDCWVNSKSGCTQ